MLNVVSTAPGAAAPTWLVQLQVEFAGDGRPPAGEDELEPMVELMTRTAGVCSVAVVPLQAGLAVAVGLTAPDATIALERARGLAVSSARYAHLGEVEVRRASVAFEPVVGTA